MLCLTAPPVFAGWLDWFGFLKFGRGDEADATGLTRRQLATGLKQALDLGVHSAVGALGQTDGYLNNPKVAIPLPDHLEKLEKVLKRFRKEKIAEEFVESMNRAAEAAVPAAANVFTAAIAKMTIKDARALLDGGDNAATEYLRRKNSADLQRRMRPIVDDAISRVGVTDRYQRLLKKAGPLANYLDTGRWDLGRYVTAKATDGVFIMIGEEEKRIREDPAARTTELLKEVFSAD
jgi:hypothetical protein